MPRILAIDDERMYPRMIAAALGPLGYEVKSASDGATGMAMAHELNPDLIITDVMMPDISGYDVIRRLRREPEFIHTPFLVLTSQTELQDKIQAFEAGADDHVSKPFEVEELVLRVAALLRRAEQNKVERLVIVPQMVENARFIAVHSLRGGSGCSTLAVNLAAGLAGLWNHPTVLIDMVLAAGQVALMLNWPLKRTWADIAQVEPEELDYELLQSITIRHESGLHFIAAPAYPTDAALLKLDSLGKCLKLLLQHHEYLIADISHDFSEVSLQALDGADVLLLVLAPELSSVRAAAAALDTYARLGYPSEKIALVLNHTFPRHAIPRDKIESALGHQITLTIPFVPDRLVEAINKGQPPVYATPNESVSAIFEDFAFLLSKERHKKTKPEKPSDGWKRVYKRYSARRK